MINVDENILNNFQKTLEDTISETKRTIFVSAFNCETRQINLISDTIDSNANFIIIDPFTRTGNTDPKTPFAELLPTEKFFDVEITAYQNYQYTINKLLEKRTIEDKNEDTLIDDNNLQNSF